MVKYLLSNFSPNMVAESDYTTTHQKLTESEFNELKAGAVAIIRNPAFARLLNVPMCRKFITLKKGDVALIVGTDGGKLDYNATSLPEGLSLTYEKIEVGA